MSYDHWKTTNPDDERMGDAEQSGPAIPADGGMYRGFRITYWAPPIPVRDMDWHFEHDDFDGAPDAYDSRHGHGSSAADCARQIDEYYDDLEGNDDQLRFEMETGANDSFDDSQALASAGMIEEA